MWYTTTIFLFLCLAKMTLNSGVFRYNTAAFHGDIIYQIFQKEEALCLRACYEESECAFVNYQEDTKACSLCRQDTIFKSSGYTLFREKTDASCTTEIASSNILFQKIETHGENVVKECDPISMMEAVTIRVYYSNGFRFYYSTSDNTSPFWTTAVSKLLLSKKKGRLGNCTPVPVFHKASFRRLFFGEIYNTTGYYFLNAYVFADYCVSAMGQCLGVEEIQEYEDEQGNFYYEMPRRSDLKDSGLGQTFFVAKRVKEEAEEIIK